MDVGMSQYTLETHFKEWMISWIEYNSESVQIDLTLDIKSTVC